MIMTIFVWVVTVALLSVTILANIRIYQRKGVPNARWVVVGSLRSGPLWLGCALFITRVPWWGMALIFLALTVGVEWFQSRLRYKGFQEWATSLGTMQTILGLQALVAIFATIQPVLVNWFGGVGGWITAIIFTLIAAMVMGVMCNNDGVEEDGFRFPSLP